jgi:hypothetical protein
MLACPPQLGHPEAGSYVRIASLFRRLSRGDDKFKDGASAHRLMVGVDGRDLDLVHPLGKASASASAFHDCRNCSCCTNAGGAPCLYQ